jgi:hypothetical protein
VVPPDDSGAAALKAALAQLYAVPPDEFVATRTRLVQEAKTSGDKALAKELGRARRPTVAAWAVNAVVREHPGNAEQLQELGQRMRAAQAQLDAAAMTELRPARDLLLGTWADDADAVGRRAGRPLTSAVGEEVRATVIAALADEEATRAVLSGHLTRSLRYSGFGEVDLSEAVVRTSSGAVLSVVPGADAEEKAEKKEKAEPAPATEKAERQAAKERAARDEQAAAREAADRERVEAAQEARDAAVEAAREARLALDQARDRADETRWRIEELEDQLKNARAEHRAAEQRATEAARARRSAEVEVARAEKVLRDAGARRG